MKFELYQDAHKAWRWHLKAANGEIIASGEGYVNKQDAVNAVNLVMGTTSKTSFVLV